MAHFFDFFLNFYWKKQLLVFSRWSLAILGIKKARTVAGLTINLYFLIPNS